jgi:hypothetical protein
VPLVGRVAPVRTVVWSNNRRWNKDLTTNASQGFNLTSRSLHLSKIRTTQATAVHPIAFGCQGIASTGPLTQVCSHLLTMKSATPIISFFLTSSILNIFSW